MHCYCVVLQEIEFKKVKVLHITSDLDDAIVKLYDSITEYNTSSKESDFYCINIQSENKIVKIEVYKKEPGYVSYYKNLKFIYEIVEYSTD